MPGTIRIWQAKCSGHFVSRRLAWLRTIDPLPLLALILLLDLSAPDHALQQAMLTEPDGNAEPGKARHVVRPGAVELTGDAAQPQHALTVPASVGARANGQAESATTRAAAPAPTDDALIAPIGGHRPGLSWVTEVNLAGVWMCRDRPGEINVNNEARK